jgi:hypothetical protein
LGFVIKYIEVAVLVENILLVLVNIFPDIASIAVFLVESLLGFEPTLDQTSLLGFLHLSQIEFLLLLNVSGFLSHHLLVRFRLFTVVGFLLADVLFAQRDGSASMPSP